ncbi:M3 family metallopeptidase [Candidatus Neomarinimicrobiota bacterium]
MKFVMLTFIALIALSCAGDPNPFFSDYTTPFQVPPFDKIKEAHYLPAYEEGMRQEVAEIEAIKANTDPATFENTIEALESTGKLLTKVDYVFSAMNGSMSTEGTQAIAKEISPKLTEHNDNIWLDADLFKRVNEIYQARSDHDLSAAQLRLLDKKYKNFVRGGANLNEADQAELREINKELSTLSVQFGENVLKETNSYELVLEEADLVGLPESAIVGAAEAAAERGHDGKWVFTIHRPSMYPFLTYSERRDLREKLLTAYVKKGDNDNELDNKSNAAKMAALRVRKAKLFGYENQAQFVLEETMAKTPENVYDLLNKVWEPALARAKAELADMQAMIDADGGGFTLEPWDWRYYAEKVRKAKYDLDDEQLRPYFVLENVRNGAFNVATKLWGITFTERKDIPKYHEDVNVFEVQEADGSHIGLLYTDYYPRESKRGGAWMSSFRKQHKLGGVESTPVIYNVGNFAKPTGDQPSLLSFDQAKTLYHEFGHALHGLLSDGTYPSLTGTSVSRDYVEMHSQIMENWASEPEVMKSYALHVESGEPIPDELIAKIVNSSYFNQGFETVEYLAAAFLDMDWHTLTDATEQDPMAFEKASMDKIGLIDEIVVRYRTPYFNHIFAGGYFSGYYGYLWAEVLDADAFEAFKETSLFDQATAQSYRENLLSKGDSEDPMVLYKRFRGAEPLIEPYLKRRGLLTE